MSAMQIVQICSGHGLEGTLFGCGLLPLPFSLGYPVCRLFSGLCTAFHTGTSWILPFGGPFWCLTWSTLQYPVWVAVSSIPRGASGALTRLYAIVHTLLSVCLPLPAISTCHWAFPSPRGSWHWLGIPCSVAVQCRNSPFPCQPAFLLETGGNPFGPCSSGSCCI